jgi:uroporphyrinogen-III synthase
MRILVTRPRDDAESFAEKLRARGHDVVIEPLIAIRNEPDAKVDLDGVQALLFTSANGVRAFAAASPRRDLGVLAVGDATATAARLAGFAAVESAGGDVEDLAQLAVQRLKPENGALLHAAGSAIAGDLSGRLEAAGFAVRRAVLYRAEPARELSPGARAALRERTVDIVVLFSPRTAKAFVALLHQAGLGDSCARAVAIGLSPAVIDTLAAIPLRACEAAAEPNEAALLAVVDRVAKPGRSSFAGVPPNLALVGVATLGVAVLPIGVVAWLASGPSPDATDALSAQLAATQRQVATLSASSTAQSDLARAVGALDQRLASLQTRIAELDARLTSQPNAGGELADLRRRIDGLSAPRTDPQIAALAAETARMQESIAALTARLAERVSSQRGDTATALAELRQAIATGRPFAGELLALQAAAGDDETTRNTLSGLVPFAERGIPPLEVLRQRFARVAADVVRARPRDPDGAWWQPGADWVESLVTVRPVGDVPGDTPAAIVARAERQMAAGNLAAADEQLAALSGPAAGAAAAWRRDAQARLTADQLVARLEPVLHGGSAAR